ncbi:putative aliphatic sulfonates ABC transporter, permease protein [Myxococcus xanthus DK 1622]|uniref:Aliphatic sulfonates ABC transporter, permease protein n=1 Tax=Myxococcus xanthus (strain DK1622) TaxID=246197 RepID=Q1DGA4_MYXXD|nr:MULTISPECIES: ABC transporter permease [Myxococcus]ABF89477.1 putative aliphatic sulfonates ABC transporter, permease protein [Myxococcus xanthus DK 1622]NOJ54784.1 ABC transporter permease [Myxococcus xanthus]QPM79776.1 ABC transporter permease [Myxococcus xanthus]QQR44609.1 ABC transporter permease [Myxococcus xanthus]QVW68839.1 ABC transporter permease [Myxococcus xanthus DZ2]
MKHHAQKLLVIALLIGLWELVARMGIWSPHLLPRPLTVAQSLVAMVTDGRLVGAAGRSLGRLLRAYLMSVALGVPLGLLISRIPFFRNAVKPVVMGLQALPSICWLPLALLWFGLTDGAILFVVVMGSVLGIAIATEDSVNGVDPQLTRVASTLGVRGLRFQFGVLLPAALPGIVTGLKLGWSFAWRALLAGELLFVSGGLGQLLTVGRELMDVPQVMAVMVAIVIIGTAVDRVLFQTVEVRLRRRWGLTATT